MEIPQLLVGPWPPGPREPQARQVPDTVRASAPEPREEFRTVDGPVAIWIGAVKIRALKSGRANQFK
jgi:hypothetical protein